MIATTQALGDCTNAIQPLRLASLLSPSPGITLKSLGEECLDRQVIAIIMETLPASYENLIIALNSHPDHNKLDYVISRIFNEETCQKEEHDHSLITSSSSSASDLALLAAAH